MTATPTPARYISARKCKCGAGYTSALLTERWPAKSKDAGPVFFRSWDGTVAVACKACGNELAAREVRGRFSAKHECGAKCMASHGPTCECSCGGRNHGAAHA